MVEPASLTRTLPRAQIFFKFFVGDGYFTDWMFAAVPALLPDRS